MKYRRMIIAGGVSFVVGALAFVFVFSYTKRPDPAGDAQQDAPGNARKTAHS